MVCAQRKFGSVGKPRRAIAWGNASDDAGYGEVFFQGDDTHA